MATPQSCCLQHFNTPRHAPLVPIKHVVATYKNVTFRANRIRSQPIALTG